MASSRMARFVSEVAPPQFVSVMRRRRTTNMLETISEDERESESHQATSRIKSVYFFKQVQKKYSEFGS
ncbi:hypothetical protein HanXRQr2_Chr01g0005331 [Helianthus annuus]|uniref:Uncharacterized protein n=1 Tax=Helianthus annuus TaxID=4232 RepID=A0A9K3JT63_HELAN|nr:hypothetical protein HanXRQr2_Chr01g0005331 [Helianthus annuus]